MNYSLLQNNQTVQLDSIPVLDYEKFIEQIILHCGDKNIHCVNYYGFEVNGKIKLMCCLADDNNGSIIVSSSLTETGKPLPSVSRHYISFEKFEREIHENFGILYSDHPWLKPVRFPVASQDNEMSIAKYPFFKLNSEELHEVGVGPIHAGIIEPGHFRFICNGEQILHLEIQLGFQHRGIEKLFIERKKHLQRITLAENIAGDMVVGHTVANVNLWESLHGFNSDLELQWIRTLALELERIAVHTGDMGALCADIGYQLGSSVLWKTENPIN